MKLPRTKTSSRAVWLVVAALPFAFSVGTPPSAPLDPVERVMAEVKSGKRKLTFDSQQGYLKSLLKELGIDENSQTLVFSKTSLQTEFITRKTPRAFYFNDHTYVGWIPDAPLIEIMTMHPTRGIEFYTIPNEPVGKQAPVPRLDREGSTCLRCHGGRGGGALFVNSVQTAPSGYARVFAPQLRVTPATPYEKRWGGWFVSGTHGSLRHMGNEFSIGTDEKHRIDVEKGANQTDLRAKFDHKRYLTPHSDIAALLVMEHQMEVHNRLSALAAEGMVSMDTGILVERLVEALLGSREAKLPAPVKGTSGFAEAYPARFPKDGQGRSLAELDLKTRTFRYGVSPVVYSESFTSLPALVRERVTKRILSTLESGQGPASHLSAADRAAAREILLATL